jgi:hypothetical protein
LASSLGVVDESAILGLYSGINVDGSVVNLDRVKQSREVTFGWRLSAGGPFRGRSRALSAIPKK